MTVGPTCPECGAPLSQTDALCARCALSGSSWETGLPQSDVPGDGPSLGRVDADSETGSLPLASTPPVPLAMPESTFPDGSPADFQDEEEEQEEEVLRTGIWRSFGSGLAADIHIQDTRVPSNGIRMRRVGSGVELQRTRKGVRITVDGAPYTGGLVSLTEQIVEVDGVRLIDDYVPHDTLDAGVLPDFFAPILIGRGPECDYVIKDDSVSSRHAGLSRQDGYLLLEDLDSANGTFVDDRRIKRMRVSWRQEFEIGSRVLTPIEVLSSVRGDRFTNSTQMFGSVTAMNLAAVAAGVKRPEELAGLLDDSGVSAPSLNLTPGQSAVVGRDLDVEVVFDTPNVSRRHARLTRTAKGMLVEDLGSTNGTWVNGERVREPCPIEPSDDVRFGHQKLQLGRDYGIKIPLAGGGATGVRVDALGLVREVGSAQRSQRVIDDVSFSILPGEMVALMGPSGAGKTSLLTTIAGYTPATQGTVFMDGLSLYDHYGLFREAVGYVPQEDVMHRALTVEEVLYYQAKLNFPAEVGKDEIMERIGTVLGQLDLQGQRHSLVGDEVRRGLSGGQRKRLNVAMELLSQPAALLLDEPTSGLDARSAMQLIRQCRGLASSGRTVIMTVHQPSREAFELFDKLLLLTKGGKLAYFGPARQASRYFVAQTGREREATNNPADFVLDALDPLDESATRSAEQWQADFAASPTFEKFVDRRLSEDGRLQEAGASTRSSVRQANPLVQLATLTSRYALLKFRDRNALGVQLLQAPVIAGLALLLFHQGRFAPFFLDDDITPTLFVLIASAVWFGCSNVAREIVGERAVFRRERMGRLRPGPYLLSKLALQAMLIAVQVGLMLAMILPVV
ncbi:MAG: FHA domain-containing protein, partial [Myxococcota bacterium]|nr:FHA domain-containing protein [Myxococcota bacterium]